MKILGKIALIIFCLLAIAVAAAFIYATAVTAGTKLDDTKLAGSECAVEIYDADDVLVASVSLGGTGKNVPLQDVPLPVRNAFIAAEDKNFYSHRGIEIKSMLRAAWKNLRAGKFVQGASTISQQLIKNTQLSAEKTLSRKLKEIKLTRKLEKQYTKDQILEMYLNTIYFGHSCYGIASACDYYFGKEPSQLNAAEGAMLAAIIRSPNRYSPFIDADKCKTVRDSILLRMRALGYLDAEQTEEAIQTPLPSQPKESAAANTYLAAVMDELQNIPLFSPYSLLRGSKIYTYMNADAQAYAETLQTDADRSGKSILVVDNRTGGAAAWFTTEGIFCRQPGSLIKPLAVYAPAIEENLLSPCTPILDERTDFGGYSPSNYKDVYHGYVSAREALAQSMNVPAVKTLNALGTERAAAYLERMEMPIEDADKTLALALGGMTRGYTLQQITAAYAMFANGGMYRPIAFIRRIDDENGYCLHRDDRTPLRVFSEDTVELVNDMLSETVKSGTAKKLSTLAFPIYAKTGTCGNDRGNTDAYTVAYTANFTTGVWMGNADNTLTDVTGGGLPCHYAMLLAKHLHPNGAHPLGCENCVTCTLDKVAYDNDHVVLLAAENQPKQFVMEEIFRAANAPSQFGTLFAKPNAEVGIRYENNKVILDLCQTEYYEYEIKREFQGKIESIFSGKAGPQYIDATVRRDAKYTYFVTPYFIDDMGNRICGDQIRLPAVYTKKSSSDPSISHRPWWEY